MTIAFVLILVFMLLVAIRNTPQKYYPESKPPPEKDYWQCNYCKGWNNKRDDECTACFREREYL